MELSKLGIFASGTPTGGGSGARNLILCSRRDPAILRADIVWVASNHESGGVRTMADELGVPFIHIRPPFTAETYQRLIKANPANYFALSGYIKKVFGLPFDQAFNIHPAPFRFGGPGMYDLFVHQAVLDAFHRQEITHSAVSMGFINDQYDRGPGFFEIPVPIYDNDEAKDLQERVKGFEHKWQPIVTDLVVNGQIGWDGVHPESLYVPPEFRQYLPA